MEESWSTFTSTPPSTTRNADAASMRAMSSRTPLSLRSPRFTRDLVTSALAPHEPRAVHTQRSPEELADLLIKFKPAFIRHPESIAHVRRITTVLGAAAELTYGDVPKLRTAFPVGGLSTGTAYAFQAHRDTWYGAPPHSKISVGQGRPSPSRAQVRAGWDETAALPGPAGRRRDALLGGPIARDDSQYELKHPVQHRFPDC